MMVLENIESVCPTCYIEGIIQKIDAQVIEENKKVWIIKNCEKHGSFKELYFGDVNLYKRWMKYKVTGHPVSDVKTSLFDDPTLYADHTSQTILTNLVVTNRCNLRCSYCFINAGAAGSVYEPSFNQLRTLMQQTRNEKPLGSKSIQITGGEPTLRSDFFDIIRLAKAVGFLHVQVHTNGLKLAENIEYCQRLKDEKVNTIYMSFNGVSKETNPLLEQNKRALENLRKVNVNVVLVPVLIGGKNIHETGKIVRFAIDNIDVVRGVHFQPISFCGRATTLKENERKSQRVEYIQLIEAIEQEFSGLISRDDFYPISILFPISQLTESVTREHHVEFTPHPGCGGSTFIVMNEGKPIPITRFINVETYIKFMNEQAAKTGPLRKLRLASAIVKNINTFINTEKAPQSFDMKQIARDSVTVGNEYALRKLHHNSLFIGMMWYQDLWNLNIDRLQRCVIHYTTFEGIIPFCTYNILGYGDKIQKKYSISVEEWEKKTGQSLQDDMA
ncbi:MAG: radical SAM protein [Euryarchaeota archaeon]|nr:radical SAM protein [Euryarchaeota archaeon]